MKELIAIIQPGKWTATKARLEEAGLSCYTTCRAYGRGKQNGLRYLDKHGEETRIGLLPKRVLWLWLADAQLVTALEVIMDVNRTGAFGDGKIFICPIEGAVRVRTGELAGQAIQ